MQASLQANAPVKREIRLLHVGYAAALLAAASAWLRAIGNPLWLDETRTGDFEGLRFPESRALALRHALQAWCADHHIDHRRAADDLLTFGLGDARYSARAKSF